MVAWAIAVVATAAVTNAAAGDADRHAVNAIFGNEYLAENVVAIRRQASRLTGHERYSLLHNWVLPTAAHDAIRLAAVTTPSDPVPPLIDDHPTDVVRLDAGQRRGDRRIHTGGNLVSPALDLIATARELGRLEELRDDILACKVSGEVQERCRLCLLSLTEAALGNEAAAGTAADALYERFLARTFPSLADRMPETLLVWAAAEQQALLPEAERFLVPMLETQIRPGVCNGPLEWDRMIESLVGRIRYLNQSSDAAAPQPYNADPGIAHWHSVSRIHSQWHGRGTPPAHWDAGNEFVANLASHEDEFLWYDIPLTGDLTFEIECSGFGYRDCHPSVAGTWIAPVYDHRSFEIGNLLARRPNMPLDPLLSQVDEWIRYRVEVRDGLCRRFINGRLVHEETLPQPRDPWMAIRSPSYGRGRIRNVRIYGVPDVPNEVFLSELRDSATNSEGLDRKPPYPAGWMPWIQDPWDPENGSWGTEFDEKGNTVIVGRRIENLTGTGAERLLRYHWPIVHDGTIHFEFLYRQSQVHVHPAMGRRAFLLNPNGIHTHWVTNGPSDRSELDPLNESPEETGRAPRLIPDTWNRAAITLHGDQVELAINDETVLVTQLHPTNDRTFGLFHDCGQTEARVRNVVWQGDWPKSLPEPAQQELWRPTTEELDRKQDRLPDEFAFDFTNADRQEFEARFETSVTDAADPADVMLQEDGLHVTLHCISGSKSTAYVSPRVMVEGDFDLIATFDDLRVTAPDNGIGAIYLTAHHLADARRYCRLFRGVIQHPDTRRREIGQAEFLGYRQRKQGYHWHGIHAEACRSGRLRIARRGKDLSFLIAAFDADEFRQFHVEEVSDEPLPLDAIRLRAACYSAGTEDGSVSVIWKNIRIKAERIFDLVQREGRTKSLPNPRLDVNTNESLPEAQEVPE